MFSLFDRKSPLTSCFSLSIDSLARVEAQIWYKSTQVFRRRPWFFNFPFDSLLTFPQTDTRLKACVFPKACDLMAKSVISKTITDDKIVEWKCNTRYMTLVSKHNTVLWLFSFHMFIARLNSGSIRALYNSVLTSSHCAQCQAHSEKG